jgi:hypothetical protein
MFSQVINVPVKVFPPPEMARHARLQVPASRSHIAVMTRREFDLAQTPCAYATAFIEFEQKQIRTAVNTMPFENMPW